MRLVNTRRQKKHWQNYDTPGAQPCSLRSLDGAKAPPVSSTLGITIMEILIVIIAAVVLFFVYQTKKTADINKLCFSPFPIWIKTYIQSPHGSVDKATLAKSLILQIISISQELKAFKAADFQEIRGGLSKLGPEESVQFVDGWIEQHLPTLEGSIDKSIIETSSARYVFMLMLIAATSVNPRGSLRDFLNTQQLAHRV